MNDVNDETRDPAAADDESPLELVDEARKHCDYAIERISRDDYAGTVSGVLHLGLAIQRIGEALALLDPDVRAREEGGA